MYVSFFHIYDQISERNNVKEGNSELEMAQSLKDRLTTKTLWKDFFWLRVLRFQFMASWLLPFEPKTKQNILKKEVWQQRSLTSQQTRSWNRKNIKECRPLQSAAPSNLPIRPYLLRAQSAIFVFIDGLMQQWSCHTDVLIIFYDINQGPSLKHKSLEGE